MNVFLPVSPNTAANGHLRYFAGSHKYGLVGQGDIQPERFQGVRDVGEDLYPGDLVLMDHCTWHHSSASNSDEPRYLLQMIYQPTDDPSYGERPELISGRWRTELRFPWSEALVYYNVRKHAEENERLRTEVAALRAQLAEAHAEAQRRRAEVERPV